MDEEINNEQGITQEPTAQDFEGPPLIQDDMTPDEAAAALAMATRMSEGLLMANAPQQPQEEIPEEPAPQMDESQIDDKIEEKVTEKIAELKKQLEDALNDEEEEDTESS